MAFIILPDGSIKVDTAEEALEMQKVIIEQKATFEEVQLLLTEGEVQHLYIQYMELGMRREVAQLVAASGGLQDARPDHRILTTMKFLATIGWASRNGSYTGSGAMQEVLGVSAPRGMAGKLQVINETLARAGYDDTDEVYIRHRAGDSAVWAAGSKIFDALSKVQDELMRVSFPRSRRVS